MLVGYPRPSFVPFLFSICNSICRCSNHPIGLLFAEKRERPTPTSSSSLHPLRHPTSIPFPRPLRISTTLLFVNSTRKIVADRGTRVSGYGVCIWSIQSFKVDRSLQLVQPSLETEWNEIYDDSFLLLPFRQPVQTVEHNLLSGRRASWNRRAHSDSTDAL